MSLVSIRSTFPAPAMYSLHYSMPLLKTGHLTTAYVKANAI